jgi:DNA-binding response OmpR family regulator
MSRILVVDDEPHIVKLIEFSLTKNGFECLTAGDGVQALELAGAEQPDLILLDVMMPIMTGFETAQKLKADPATKDIPIVFLSAKSQTYEIEEGLECGASDYICKPFTPKDLVEKVSSALES